MSVREPVVGDAGPVRVTSEVGRLRHVLVHEPGPEVDRMTPVMMDELLFDDTLFGEKARNEHRRFRRVLQLLGVRVREALDLLEETLAVPEGRRWIAGLVRPHLLPEYRDLVDALPPRELAETLVAGHRREEGGAGIGPDDLFGIRPLPNWCFQRDTQVILDGGVIFASMATFARHREALLSRAIFRFHPEFRAVPVLHDPGEEGLRNPPGKGGGHGTLEGGDVLVISPDLLAVGRSERTDAAGIRALVDALARREGGPRWLIQAELPHSRAFMHLDTLFTPVDRDACLVYPPVLAPGAAHEAIALEYDLHAAEPRAREVGSFLGALARRGTDLEPIPCGGSDPMMQQREQWTDGANVLALAPGVVVLYDRNVATAEELGRRGFRVAAADDLLLGRTDLDLDSGERICILMPASELSRARGGAHCLTHPLVRDDLDPAG